MAHTSAPAPRTTTITECANCGVDKDVHVLDGCTSPSYQRVRVCRDCHERPDLCTC